MGHGPFSYFLSHFWDAFEVFSLEYFLGEYRMHGAGVLFIEVQEYLLRVGRVHVDVHDDKVDFLFELGGIFGLFVDVGDFLVFLAFSSTRWVSSIDTVLTGHEWVK